MSIPSAPRPSLQPAPRTRSKRAPRAAGTASARPGRAHQARLLVLVVDDDEYVLRVLEQVLPRRRLHLLAVSHAAAAFALAPRTSPSVAIVDVGLPDLDGYEVARRLREQLAPCPPRIVLLTDQLPDRARVKSAQPDRVISKPFHLADLRETVLALAEQWEIEVNALRTEAVS